MGGGHNNGSKTNTCEFYDITNDKWVMFGSLHENKHKMSASILNNRFIYLFGGERFGLLNTIEQYDIVEK